MQEIRRFEFGPFVLDPSHGMLSSEGRPAALSGRAASILQALIEANGAVVTKQALLERAWPGTILEEGNLTVQIAGLRKSMSGITAEGRDWIITVPRVGYRLAQPATSAVAQGAGRPVIAVMPFTNLSGDPVQDYFGEGVVEELTTALSRFRTFGVVARSSAFALRERKEDVRQIARELGVAYVLDGSVRRSGDRVRVATHLVDAASGLDLWTERFDGQLADIFDVEDRITEAVVGLIEPQIRKVEIERARRKRPENLGAYDFYLRALPHLYAPRPDQWTGALEHLERAIALDPDFAPALAVAAWTHEKRIRQYLPPLGPDDTREALSLARRALAADSDDAMVLAIGGWVPIAINSEFETGLALVRRAMEMNPNNLVVLNLVGSANVFAGDLEEAEAAYLRAFRLSPRAPDAYWSLTGLGQVHLLTGAFEESINWLEQSLAVNDSFPMTLGTLAAAYALSGRVDEARALMQRLLALKPHMTLERMAARRIRDRGRWRNTVEGLRLAGMPET